MHPALAAALLVCTSVLAVPVQTPPPPPLHSIDATETLVKARLAAELKVAATAIAVVSREERRWPDAAFGCAPRKGVFEPVPIDGYAFALSHKGVRYAFRTDKYGTVRRCAPGRPRGSSPQAH